ncbi:hypothetical protein Slin14017_G006570 [Septoria linicola]|nr:hypothetical protein Slin14017_G006570 [Septoria linicola]
MLSTRFAPWHPSTCAQRCSIRSTRDATFLKISSHRRHFGATIAHLSRAQDGTQGNALVRHGVFTGIVATQQSKNETIDQVIAKVDPEAHGKPLKPNANPSLLAILVTPSFAKHANDSSLALRLLERFNANPTASKPLESLTAVVDRLPVSASSVAGAEGLAYALITDPLQSHAGSLMPLQSNATKPGSLSFDISTGTYHITAQMPLAQTIFMTGVPSTLIHTQYQFDPLTGRLRKQSSQFLESASVPLPESLAKGGVTLHAPMVPLTLPRRVESSMGNIVRKLSAPQSTAKSHDAWSTKTISASQELEAAVSKYFTLRSIAPEAVEVWALILPDRISSPDLSTFPLVGALNRLNPKSLEQIWLGEHEAASIESLQLDNLLPALTKGARMCKVLSGGGGWGKKAGLLSLDPDSQYSTRELRGNEGWEFTFDGDTTEEMMAAGRKQALGEVVEEGESIVFFLANRPDILEMMMPNEDGSGSSTSQGQIVLGALPTSTNSTPTADTQSDTHRSGYFGALCEGGMALTIAKHGTRVTSTKTDIPHARLSINCSDTRLKGGHATANDVK